ncbi:hypothetical protein [Spirosoma rhododendri]|uniref:Outer membrane protein beta-barrel domain-containing protein n=1 Tax=Spirosoma rhododendri TaxID=2728024 RepID=A0A7L5DPK9_9BACT|nr:hypothetical protein [Spirosoma rhododendri]QJD80336.1 hypothetical protein HH216_19325 [Spirosoma rhododendri]
MFTYSFLLSAGLLSLCLPLSANAQRAAIYQEQPGTWLASVSLGTTRYAGDMNEPGDFSHLRLGASVALSGAYRLSTHAVLRAEAQLYYIYGSHEHTRIDYNNLSFHSLNPDVWAGVQVDLWPTTHRTRPRSPYLLAGLGLTYMSPKATYQGHEYDLAPMHTEGVDYNRLPLIIRYGFGYPLVTDKRWRLHLEGTYTHVMSDYLDDLSTVYPDFSQMSSLAAALSDRRSEIGLPPNRPGAKRGNSDKNDGYFIVSVRGVYVIRTRWDRGYRRSRRG